MSAELQSIGPTASLRWVLPCPKGCEEVLAAELKQLGVTVLEVKPTVVEARATLQEGYRMVLWSRVASRVVLPIVCWDGPEPQALYDAVHAVPWTAHFNATDTFSIGYSQAPASEAAAHFFVQRAKDAVVDRFRDEQAQRPSVDKKDPAIRFHLHIGQERHEFGLDFSGGGQHRRGYRHAAGSAPLKENLAAAILYLADWPGAAAEGRPLLDPTCGSGTFLIEAALMASDCAPGLLRRQFGFKHWRLHDQTLFEAELHDARAKRRGSIKSKIFGCDPSAQALSNAQENARAAGVTHLLSLREGQLSEAQKPAEHGVLVCNPPYGHRLGDEETLFLFYQQLGDTLKQAFGGWTAFVFAAHNAHLKHLGLKPASRHVLYNGTIECRLLEIPIRSAETQGSSPSWRKPSPAAEMFVNRIKKNRRKWERWAERQGVDCYRLYDGDIPEYNVAVERFAHKALVHVYTREADAGSEATRARVQDVLLTLPAALDVPADDVIIKTRHRHEEGDQYLRLDERGEEFSVHEGKLQFLVNLHDRIDTGLFLDHRKVRAGALGLGKGKRVLNLFAYTCSISVAGAVGGAQTTSVDLSNTYLDWGRRNFKQNAVDPAGHRFVPDDAMRWLARCRDQYDWVFINPPTFSRSKKTKGTFNIHQHHTELIDRAMRTLRPDGELLFTTHARSFRLDRKLLQTFDVTEAGKALVPDDFKRSPFSAWVIRQRA